MKDPTCGVEVDEQSAQSRGLCIEYEGCTYCFSSPGCKEQFQQNPRQYASQGNC
ncbi:MAG: YHS domain-containing protein [Chloroflexota bacterium]